MAAVTPFPGTSQEGHPAAALEHPARGRPLQRGLRSRLGGHLGDPRGSGQGRHAARRPACVRRPVPGRRFPGAGRPWSDEPPT